jgi:hypothetical protein
MRRLADAMVYLIVEEHGVAGFLHRLSDPYWFQAFGCVLGYDWHSSGLTTVVTGVLRCVLTLDRHGVAVAGGKGRRSLQAQEDIATLGEQLGFSSARIEELRRASRLVAKVDTALIQAGYPLYHHTFFLTERGDWCVVQQGMNEADRTARRYHWLSEGLASFVVEPHRAVVGDKVRDHVLNMTAREAEENRRVAVDLVKGRPQNLVSSIRRLAAESPGLDPWIAGAPAARPYQAFRMPRRLNWEVFHELYNRQPRGYEELIDTPGVGPATVRALALVAELIYGAPACWRDPVKYSFAHGGKDGVPFPVNRRVMDRTIRHLREAVEGAELSAQDRKQGLKRLAKFAQQIFAQPDYPRP